MGQVEAVHVCGDMGIDGSGDVEGEGQGGAAVFPGDDGAAATDDGVEECLDLETERLTRGDGWPGELEAGRLGKADAVGRQGCCLPWTSRVGRRFDDHNFLAGVVDRDVLVWLKKAEFADAFGADAAGGEVGDAPGFELHANVSDVRFT